jgi:site-specific DNA-methyltransferase (adenine-specific)
MNKIIYDDCLFALRDIPDESVDLVYIDPPFNTGKVQRLGGHEFQDSFDNYGRYLQVRLEELHRVLKKTGSLFFHIDYREAPRCRMLLDEIFGVDCLQNEIIWSYDFGGRGKRRWPAKHDNIYWYSKNPKNYTFNYGEIDRVPYLAPGLCGPEKAARGKTPTDVWWQTIVPTGGKERTGYPTQKPLAILERIVKVHSNVGDRCLDAFAGSGTFGEAAAKHGRLFTMVDNNPEAVAVMQKRLAPYLGRHD